MKIQYQCLFGISFTLKPNNKSTTRIICFHLWSIIFQICGTTTNHCLAAVPRKRENRKIEIPNKTFMGIQYINCSQMNVEIGNEACSFLSGNICFKYLVHWTTTKTSKLAAASIDVVGPDPDWIWILLDQWFRIQAGKGSQKDKKKLRNVLSRRCSFWRVAGLSWILEVLHWI